MLRKDVAQNLTWDLGDMYPTEEDWLKDFQYIQDNIPRIAEYAGKLSASKTILECLKFLDELSAKAEKMCVYAFCKRDENTSDAQNNSRLAKAMTLMSQFEATAAFIQPELCKLSCDELLKLSMDKKFSDYDYMLQSLIKQKDHILSDKEEKLLAMMSDFDDFQNIFTMIDNADINLPKVNINGEDVQLSHGVYAQLLQNPDQQTRKIAFENYYSAYIKLINTITANYYANVKKNVFNAKVRNYSSYLEMALESEDVPKIVYNKLIQNITEGQPAMHKYIALRKKLLGVDELHMYDLYTSVVKGVELSLPYQKACDLVVDALSILGSDYKELLQSAINNRWIDVMETENKRSGAYSIHAATANHPYVLLNYSGTAHDIFTIAHELGHSMHSHFSAKAQPLAKANYKIFVAEVASTVNEMLLLNYLLKTTQDKEFKKFLLAYKLDAIRTTVYRQTMFSQFELLAHQTVEQGVPLTVQNLNDMYLDLNKKYYGESVISDDSIKYEWARIPHFYRAFYVYKYATGLTSALDIAERISNGEEGMQERYRQFLSAGGSKSPYEILCDCGVDLATDTPYKHLVETFEKTTEELTKLCQD